MLRALILKFLMTLTVQYEDVGNPLKQPQLEILADSIAQVSRSPEEAARIITMGYWETGFGLRVHSGNCRKYECDHGLARGPWQVHQEHMPLEQWQNMRGIDHTLEQAQVARDRIEQKRNYCDGSFESTVAVYMGMGCKWRSKATRQRAAFYAKALSALTN